MNGPQDTPSDRKDGDAPSQPPSMPPALATGADGDNLEPALAALLQAFWDTHQEAPGKRLSLARLSKRADLPMSTLRRMLTELEDAGLLTVATDEDGTGSVVPSPELLGLIEDVFG